MNLYVNGVPVPSLPFGQGRVLAKTFTDESEDWVGVALYLLPSEVQADTPEQLPEGCLDSAVPEFVLRFECLAGVDTFLHVLGRVEDALRVIEIPENVMVET